MINMNRNLVGYEALIEHHKKHHEELDNLRLALAQAREALEAAHSMILSYAWLLDYPEAHEANAKLARALAALKELL